MVHEKRNLETFCESSYKKAKTQERTKPIPKQYDRILEMELGCGRMRGADEKILSRRNKNIWDFLGVGGYQDFAI